jgi:hypothetical protein
LPEGQRLAPFPAERAVPAQLLSGDDVSSILQQISRDYEAMAAQLANMPEGDLGDRLKAYDNHDRFTFGRAFTRKFRGRELRHGWFRKDRFQAVRPDDRSQFPGGPFFLSAYPGVRAAVERTIEILGEDLPDDEEALLSIYCHRVLVRPGSPYRGFRHRDNKVREKCGTCVWYPRLDAEKVEGVTLFCKLPEPGLSEAELRARQPELRLPAAEYRGKVMVMRYPHNLFHGVEPGAHRAPAEPGRERRLADFFQPQPADFIKDLVIVTLSEEPNFED